MTTPFDSLKNKLITAGGVWRVKDFKFNDGEKRTKLFVILSVQVGFVFTVCTTSKGEYFKHNPVRVNNFETLW